MLGIVLKFNLFPQKKMAIVMFDKELDRKKHHAMKWQQQNTDIIPMWVADMDFEAPKEIQQALQARLQQMDLGYTLPWASLNQSVVDWCLKQYQWQISPEHIVWTPGVVPAFNVACKMIKKSKVLVQSPNYPPLLKAASLQQKTLLTTQIVNYNGRWQLDFADLENKLADPECGLFILCNPMNPHGSILNTKEMQLITQLCQQYQVQLCSDEIHCDLIMDGTHQPAGKYAQNAITLMAASKTFNIAGLGCSFAVISDSNVRQQFQQQALGLVPWPNLLGYVATEAAFTYGATWHQQLLQYLTINRDFLINTLQAMRLNQKVVFSVNNNPACFFVWVDCRLLEELTNITAMTIFINAGIQPSDGKDFGQAGFIRLNFACPLALLKKAMGQLSLEIAKYD